MKNISEHTTISSYLPFSDDTLQFIDVMGWDGQAIEINREFYMNFVRAQIEINREQDIFEELKERNENIEGIYILFGEDLEETNPLLEGVAYIGETSNFKQRMNNYFRVDQESDKDWCSNIFFFSRKSKLGGAGLQESLRKAIESELIQESVKVGRYKVKNISENYNEKINLSDKDLLKEFITKIKIILENKGILLLKEQLNIPEDDIKNYFICIERNSNATMYRGNSGYVVLKDSIIIKENLDRTSRYYKKILEKKTQLIQEKFLMELEEDNTKLILKENQEFNSPSGAAAFVTGGTYNGNVVWKKKDNPDITLGQFLQHETSS